MAEPISATVIAVLKTVGKTIAKEAAKISASAVQAGTAGKVATGIDKLAKGLTEIQKLNVLRAKVDPKMVKVVADSLGISTKELKAITDKLRLTEARKKVVTGRNYIRNVNKLVNSPYSSIQQYIKDELRQKTKKGVEKQGEKARDEIRKQAVVNALKLLEGKLQKIDPTFNLSDVVWDSIEVIDIEDIYTALTYVEMDLYGDSGQQESEHIFLDAEHKGYQQGLVQSDFQMMLEDMILQGYHSKMIDAIY